MTKLLERLSLTQPQDKKRAEEIEDDQALTRDEVAALFENDLKRSPILSAE